MTDIAVTDALIDHFQRTWAMLRVAVENFPDETWAEDAGSDQAPARIAYHILLSSERYTWQGLADDYIPNRRFSLNWETTPLAQLPTKPELLQHFQDMEARTMDWLRGHGDDGLKGSGSTFAWVGHSALAQALYLLRHLQHHVGQLNVELRRRGLLTADWK